MTRLEKDNTLRLFQQLHQDSGDRTNWFRASGACVCLVCGLYYRDHPLDDETNVDKRLCDGFIVHL